MFDIDYGILIAQIFNFLILFFVFKYFISDNVDELVEKRKSLLEKLDKADLLYQQKIQEAENKSKTILDKAHNDAKAFTDTNEKITENKAKAILDKANKNVIYIIEQGKKEIEQEKLDMIDEIKKDAIDLSIKLNEKLFDKKTVNEAFIKGQMSK